MPSARWPTRRPPKTSAANEIARTTSTAPMTMPAATVGGHAFGSSLLGHGPPLPHAPCESDPISQAVGPARFRGIGNARRASVTLMHEHGPTRPVALVTGASSGIGAVYAERLASIGHDLVLVARRSDRLEELAGRLGKERGASARVGGGRPFRSGRCARRRAPIAGEPGLALLVNNAGFSGYMPFVELPPDQIDRLVEIHCIATARLTRAALPGMIAAGRGGVVNVASLLAFSRRSRPIQCPTEPSTRRARRSW